MKQLPNQLMFKIWPIFCFSSVEIPISRLFVLVGPQNLLNAMMSLKPASPDAITASAPSVETLQSSRSG